MANEKRLIDANALTDEFLRHYTEQEKKGNLSFVACEIKQGFADMVNEATTVDAVEVVHGRWISQSCSVCNGSYMDYADADSYPAIGEPKPNYCPNCGARMDGE